VRQALEQIMLETGHAWEQNATAGGEVPEIIGAVDETFLEHLLLVFLDLPPGYILREEAVEDRSYATWKALVDQRLAALGAPVRSLGSARAKALLQLAQQGLECRSIPDMFHLVHDIVKSYTLALGRQLKQARREGQKAEDGLQKAQALDRPPHLYSEVRQQVEVRQAEGRRWEAIQREYRQRLEALSLTLHPFAIDDSAPQTSTQVDHQLHAQVEALERLPTPSRCRIVRRLCTRSKNSCLPWRRSWTFGGQGCGRTWSPPRSPASGGRGRKRRCCPKCMGSTK
jgi:hypothetical protein